MSASTARFVPSLALPIAILAFILTSPHGVAGWVVLVAVVLALIGGDRTATAEPEPVRRSSAAPDAVLIAAGLLHACSPVALAMCAATMPGPELVASIMLAGVSSAFVGGIVGHELVHRRSRALRMLGRLLLWPALYDHFAIEHIRGHHVGAARVDDPTTARFDEPFWPYVVRSVPGQIASAWQIDHGSTSIGLALELALLGAMGLGLGAPALGAWLAQAVVATVLISAVNWFDHWGLDRGSRRFAAHDAWDGESSLSHVLLLGLPAHPDHHLHAARPYDELVRHHESPKLPLGYVRMVLLVVFRSGEARRLLREELQRRWLVP
jgi:alkane 1-monooxygenase